jgi:hypothetical protein
LWALPPLRVVAFSRVSRRFLALFGVVQCHNQNVKTLMVGHAEDSTFFNDTSLGCVLSPNINSPFAFPLLFLLVQPLPLSNFCASQQSALRFHFWYNS